MRVAVDARSLDAPAGSTLRQARGISRHALGVLQGLVDGHPEDEWHLVTAARGTADGAPPVTGPSVHWHRRRLPSQLAYGAQAVGRGRMDRMLPERPDVAWLPAPAPVALSAGVPYVLTVHDLSFEQRPGDFTAYERVWQRAARPRELARGAAAVLAVSDATAAEVAERWQIAPEVVTVVRPGLAAPSRPSDEEIAETTARHGLAGPYVLFVGALEPRKGLEVLTRAWGTVCQERGVAAGGQAHGEAAYGAGARGELAQLAVVGQGRLSGDLAGPGVRLLGRVPEAELWRLYAGARLLVLPSLLEGFGFPPLEAAALGTPSVLSDLPALREVLGPDGARWVPPGDIAALAVALSDLLGDASRRRAIATVAKAAVAQLDSRHAAETVHTALHRAASQRRDPRKPTSP
ncbi:MAG: glycosyltransferase family 4 protein [Solirubrobacterales bacterium]